MSELQLFAEAASTEAFLHLSLVFILAYAALALWLSGRASARRAQRASLIRRAL